MSLSRQGCVLAIAAFVSKEGELSSSELLAAVQMNFTL